MATKNNPKWQARYYYNRETGLWARCTQKNELGNFDFIDWKPEEEIPEKHCKKLAFIQLLPEKQKVEFVGSWRVSKNYRQHGYLIFFLYKDEVK